MSEHIENRALLPDWHEQAAPAPSPQLLALKDSLEARLRANDTSENATLRAENARLRGALRRYAMHGEYCGYQRSALKTECTCGLTAALQETRHE